MSTDPTTLAYRVDGMSCEHCKAAVTQEVEHVAGVESVGVDLGTKLVRVAGTGLDSAAVVVAIEHAGYEARPA